MHAAPQMLSAAAALLLVTVAHRRSLAGLLVRHLLRRRRRRGGVAREPQRQQEASPSKAGLGSSKLSHSSSCSLDALAWASEEVMRVPRARGQHVLLFVRTMQRNLVGGPCPPQAAAQAAPGHEAHAHFRRPGPHQTKKQIKF